MIDSGVYKTSDLGAAAYVKTMGIPVEVKINGSRGVFEMDKKVVKDVEDYFSGKGDFITFANNQRNLKSQVQNLKGVNNA